MKLALSTLFLVVLTFQSKAEIVTPEVVPSEAYFMEPIYQDPYRIQPFTYTPIAVGPSEKELSLQAKLDSQEVRINKLHDFVDSNSILLSKQMKLCERLKHSESELQESLDDQANELKNTESNLKTNRILLGISALLALVFGIMLITIRRNKR